MRKLPAKTSRPPSVLSPDDVRSRLLAAAGLDEVQQAADLRLAFEQVRGALGAMSPLAPTAPDWFARLQAAKFVRDTYGAAPSKTSVNTSATQVVVNVDLPEWAMPKPVVVDVKPA